MGFTTQQELDTSPTNAQEKEVRDGSVSIERELVDDSPFFIVGTEKHGYWLTMGEHRLSRIYKTKKEVKKYMKAKDWALLSAVMIAFIHGRSRIDKSFTKDLSVHPKDKATETAKNVHL